MSRLFSLSVGVSSIFKLNSSFGVSKLLISLSSMGVDTWSDLWSGSEPSYGEDLDLDLGKGNVEDSEGRVDTSTESGEYEYLLLGRVG